VNAEAFATFLVQAAPDVVALQESDAETEYKWPDGWHIQRAGQLLVATRHPISHTDTLLRRYPPGPWPPVEVLRCVLETPSGQVAVCNLHLQTPREGLSEVLDRDTVVNPLRSGTLAAEIDFRRREAEHVAQWLEEFSEPFVIAGDFNMPVDSRIYQECFSNYTNAFSSTGFGFGFTKWTPIHGCSFGMRIDHILTDSDWRVRRSWIGPGAGSDHLPLLADLVKQDVPREKIQKHREAQPTPPP
jgi:vancomycin resistance protein VanJ